jgi:hypothetical protein
MQTYNKINGAIQRYFGKQMNKEIKLRIHNIRRTRKRCRDQLHWRIKEQANMPKPSRT